MMSFEKKIIDTYSRYKEIDKPDYNKRDLTSYVDFLELMALFSNSDGVTRGDFQDRLFGTDDYEKASKRDKDEAFVDMVFQKAIQRSLLYSENYPFYIEKQQSEIFKLKDQFNDSSKLYLLLLISSNLYIFSAFKSVISKEFEKISALTLKGFLPKNAITKEFGENTTYKGNTATKIKALAKEAGLKINDEEVQSISPNNSKERGCDIFSWIDFGDKNKNKLVFISQCTCQKSFESKLSEVVRFSEYFHFYKKEPIYLFFIPFSYVNQDNIFENTDMFIRDYLYFERFRIVTTCKSFNFSNLENSRLVNALIKYKEQYIE